MSGCNQDPPASSGAGGKNAKQEEEEEEQNNQQEVTYKIIVVNCPNPTVLSDQRENQYANRSSDANCQKAICWYGL